MTNRTFARALGSNIKAELRRKGYTQLDAAHVLGMKSQSAISDRLNGDVRFGFDEVLMLAEWLDVPVSDFLVGLPRLDSNQQPAGYLRTVRPIYSANPKMDVNLPPFRADIPTTVKVA